MRRSLKFVLAGLLLGLSTSVLAHRLDEYLQATLLSVGPGGVTASMRLVPGEAIAPSVIAAIDIDRDGAFSETEQRAYADRVLSELLITVDGVAVTGTLETWSYPMPTQMREGLGEIRFEYTIALTQATGRRTLKIQNRHRSDQSVYLVNVLAPSDSAIHILGQRRDAGQTMYALDFAREGSSPDSADMTARLTGWWRGLGLGALFDLGMKHIAEGADHFLFLLALLLPAPLSARGARWGRSIGARQSLTRVLGIITSFTLGHSITLTLAAVSGWTLPSQPVEVLIALSILVSALHAMQPIFPGRETWVAAGFGLGHGLAFASALDRLGLGLWQRIAGTLAFNLGVEVMQLIVIASVLPSLLLISKSRAYPAVRWIGASLAGVAAAAWVAQRLLDFNTHIDEAVEMVTRHAWVWAGLLLIAALFCYILERRERGQSQHGQPLGEQKIVHPER